VDWSTVQVGIPQPKQPITVDIDRNVIAWFKAQGPDYQMRMNQVLRGYVNARQR